jgi:hypothetical protein
VAADVGDLEFGKHLEDRGEFHLALGAGGLGLDARLAGHAQVLLAHRLAEGLLDGRADGLGTRLGAVHLLHHLHRHLAGTEARQLGVLRHALELLFHLAVDFGQRHDHLDTALQRAGHGGGCVGFLSRFHEESLKSNL